MTGNADLEWSQDLGEIVRIAWIDPKDLSPATTRAIHWPALQKAGLL
ncbi:MAG TPA: hypothetical protein VFN74_14570 [Chloroflexota bacterium]|nr:hypothetical protein [Chloroflexota bacterium]